MVLPQTHSPKVFKEALFTTVKAVNFICGGALQHRLFKAFCKEVGANYLVLLLHTEVRWLFRGCVLNRWVKLSQEMAIFLQEADHPKAIDFKDKKSFLKLLFLQNYRNRKP